MISMVSRFLALSNVCVRRSLVAIMTLVLATALVAGAAHAQTTPSLTSPAQGAVLNTTSPTFTGTGTPGATVHVELDVGQGLGFLEYASGAVSGGGGWSVFIGGLPTGVISLRVREDVSGVFSAYTATRTFTIAGTAPGWITETGLFSGVAGGAQIIVDGTNLSGASVAINGAAATVTGNTATQVTFLTPPNPVGEYGVLITTATGTVTIEAGAVYINGISVSTAFDTPSIGVGGSARLTFTLTRPNLNRQQVGFSATLPAGLQVAATPNAANAGGCTTVVFAPVAGSSVVALTSARMNVASCTFSVDVTATTSGAKTVTPGPVSGTVGGTVIAGETPSGASLTVTGAGPTVTALSPTTGPAAGGTVVTLTGTDLTGATAVSFGSTAATAFTVNSTTEITATAPAGTGTVDVTVTTPGGTSATTGAGNDFTYVAAPVAPTVTGLSPATGPVAGGTSVTLTGTHFTGATAVNFGSTAASAFTVNSATSITATAPAGTGTVDVTVTAPGGTSATSGVGNDFTFVAAPGAPVVVTPANGSVTNDSTPTVTGSAPSNATVNIVVDGSAAGSVTANGAGAWSYTTTTLVDGSHTVSATATNAGGGSPSSNTSTFTVDTAPPAAPVVVSPSNGAVINSATPSVTGTAEAGSTVTVVIDGAAAGTTTANGSGAWSFTAPTLSAGSHTVRAIATDAAGNVSPSSGTNTFTYSLLGLPGGALAGGQVGAAYSAQVTASGGAAPYVYALTGGTLPAGVSLASGGTFSGTPTVSGNYSFSVTVSDNNSLTASGTFTIAVAAPAPPAADPDTATVTATGGPQGINLAGAVGNAASIEIVSPPSRGSATVNGFVVNYTPAPGYFGVVTFTYRAVGFANGSTPAAESAPATVTITIPDPVLALPGGALPPGQAALAYSRTLSASGGTAPYTYAVTTGALPAGISLSPAGVISGTPTAGGSFNFTVTATDSSTGTGPFRVAGAYTLEIAAPSIVLAPGALADGRAAVSYSQTITASGGNGPYTYAVTAGALPAGLSLSSGGLLSGTPTAGGAFNFTVTATDSTTGAGPYTGSQAFTLTVNAATIVVTPTSIPAARRGFAYSQSMSATGGNGPYAWALSSGALPAGVSLSSAGALSGTPTVTGTFNFQVSATDSSTGSGPYAGTVNLTLVVNAATIAVTPVNLPGVMAGLPYDQSMSASGGSGAYSYTVTAGAPPAGITLSSTGRISGRSYVVGAASFTVTATDAFGNTGSAALVLAILPRPDPSADPDVRGINAAQAEATRRLTSTQIDNFSRRLEQLRTGETDEITMGLQLQSGIASLEQDADPRSRFGGGRLFDQPAINPDRAELNALRWSHDDDERGQALARGFGRRSSGAAGSRLNAVRADGGSAGAGGVRFWTGGAIAVGDRDADNGQAKFSLTSTGVSIGADLALSPTLDLGFGGGVGRETADVGDLDSRVESDTLVGVVYGGWRPEVGVHIEGVLGYGSLSFDTRRRVTIDNSLVIGDRDGTVWFGSLGVGYDQSVGDGRLSTYGRLESIEADLDAYVETGSPLWALSYDARDVSSLQGVVGGRYVWSRVGRDTVWTPSLRAEYRQELVEGGLQSLGYVDVPGGAAYQIEQSGWDRGELNLGLGLNLITSSGWAASAEVGGRFSDDQALATLEVRVSTRF